MRPLSEILLEFAQPLLGDKPDEHRFRAVMEQMVLLWNLALLPPTEQDLYWKQIAGQLQQGLPPQVVPEYLRELRAMLRWRKSHYGNDRRAISHYELKWATGQPRLKVFFTESKNTS
jgi:hypothetical protein